MTDIVIGDRGGVQNEHEICVVGDAGFRELSAFDPLAEQLLGNAVEHDQSDAWFARKGGKMAVS